MSKQIKGETMTDSIREVVNVRLEIALPGDETSEPHGIEFIYGLQTDGLTPFERKLADKVVGESLLFRKGMAFAPDFFGHLYPVIAPFLVDDSSGKGQDVQFTVTGVSPAANRDIVKALAQKISCGSGDCGCGCC